VGTECGVRAVRNHSVRCVMPMFFYGAVFTSFWSGSPIENDTYPILRSCSLFVQVPQY
jgi:hypothetical protein